MTGRLLAVSLLWLAGSAAEAGPWPAGKRHFYSKLGQQYLRSTTLAAPDGTAFKIPVFREDYVDLYAAVGLDDRSTFIVGIPLLRSTDLADSPDELSRESGFGDLRFGLQAQVGRRGPWVFATRGIAQAPTGDETRSQGLQATGSGVWEGEGWLGAGRSLAGGKGYGFLELGYNYRGGGLRDGLLYALQVGWNVGPRLVLAANLRGLEPLSMKPGSRTAGSFVGVGDRVTYAVYGPTAIVKLGEGWGLQLDVEGAFRTRNLATGTVVRTALTFAR